MVTGEGDAWKPMLQVFPSNLPLRTAALKMNGGFVE